MSHSFTIITENRQMRLFYEGTEIKHLTQIDFTDFIFPEVAQINFSVSANLVKINLDSPKIEKFGKNTEELLVEEILKREEEIIILKKEIENLREMTYVQTL